MALGAGLLKEIEQAALLSASQMKEVREVLAPRCADPAGLLKELVRREWLTEFQAKALHNGHKLLLGHYLILDGIGKGGSGQIFKARHTRTNQLVALKVLHRDLVKDNGAVQRFYREIEVASHLSHPNIVQSHEAGPMGPALVLAMEYVQGTNLERRVEKAGPLPVEQACDYIRQAAEGLDYAQQRGLVHRDIKPANLLLDQTGVVKILDLGLARLTEYAAGSKTQDLTIHENKSVMQGTPDYMAPEQALDFHRVDTRADIYSLGCTLFYLLSGKPPFPADTLAKKLMKHQQLAAPVETLRIPSGLAAVLRKLLAKKPEDRYQTPGEVVKALTPFCRPGSTEARESSRPKLGLPAIPSRQRLLLAGGGGLALLILCFFLFRGGAPSTSPAGQDRAASAPAALASASAIVPAKIAAYGESYQSPTPAAGWQYLWNQKGPVGNPAHYVPLVWNVGEGFYDVNGQPGPGPNPAGHVFCSRHAGHPGQHADGYDRCVIAAYTVQPRDGPGPYYLIRSSIGRGNGLRVIVHVNQQSPIRDVKVPANPNPPAIFDTALGQLKPGDTVYVTVGADGNDGDDTFDRFDFTIFRGQPSESDRPLVPRSTTNAFEYPDLLADVAPGFSVGGLHEGRLSVVTEHAGRKRVLQTHPASQEMPCILSQRLRLPAGKKNFLVLDVSHHPDGDWQLVVNASGQTLLDEKIGKDTVKNGWAHFEVNLAAFAGRDVSLELFNAASGWHNEHGYWGKIAIESR